jgi:serine-type D-Ala-D-Ala carboxypeptidase/endopeptidase
MLPPPADVSAKAGLALFYRAGMNRRTAIDKPLTRILWLAAIAAALALAAPTAAQTDAQKAAFAALDPLFETFMRQNQVPGLVYGVVVDGQLAHVRAFGVQDIRTKSPVTPETVFRIASMSKHFTALAALKLRDEGKLSFDAPAERYVPGLSALRYPTADSPKIAVRDLLSHSAGFVTDDPWGDRQLDMVEAEFTRFLAGGVPLSRPPGTAFEYSNFGYALVGRLVTNLSGRNYADYIREAFLLPLGMTSTGYDVTQVDESRRAVGYRWVDNNWIEEPALGPGVFGAMGGLMTTANDYARYVGWLLSAWPPRDGPEDNILRRASVRETTRGQTFAGFLSGDPPGCGRSESYGFGMIPYNDCVLGFHVGHSGGLPGYGSNVLMLPERGLGLFAFANRTYAPAARVVRDAAGQLVRSGAFPVRPRPVAAGLQAMAAAVLRIYGAGDVLAARDALAMNVLLDRDAVQRNAQIAALKQTLGACGAAEPIRPDNAMSATVTFPCAQGVLRVRIVLAPTTPASLQTLEFLQ